MSGKERLTIDSLKDRRVTVMGLGRFGGGASVTRFLVSHGAIVTLTDLASEADLGESLAALEPHWPARMMLGRHDESDFRNTDLVIVNPAVKPDNPYLKIAQDAGIPLTSEMNLFWQFHRGKTVAVTGSNGKSTTTAMIHAILQKAGICARLGGNIGHSLLEEVESIQPDDWTVLELSSFQLRDLDRIHARPDVAVVTNFTPNHLDWHGTLDDYRHSKQSILRWQTANDVAVLNADDTEVADWPTRARTIYFGENDSGQPGVFAVRGTPSDWHVRKGRINQTIPLGNWLQVPGRHNQQNAAAAIAAALSIGESLPAAKAALESFLGLPHRLQFIIETAGRRFFNDSIATTPESVIMALGAFQQPIILLAGGYDKGIDLTEMSHHIAQKVKAVALLGTTATVLKDHWNRLRFPEDAARICHSLAEAVEWAGDQSLPGDVILLSPGCASYDWFRNFVDRGEQFTRLAKEWQAPRENINEC